MTSCCKYIDLSVVIITIIIICRTDYVTWNGPNTSLRKGNNKSMAAGPNPANSRGSVGSAGGPNPANRKGSQGLAKGSIYSMRNLEASSRSN